MENLDVKCPNCRRVLFKTTDKYEPDVTPTGASLRSLLPYQHDWLCSSTTSVAELTCPECCAQLAPSGRLTVIETTPVTPMEVGIPGEEQKVPYDGPGDGSDLASPFTDDNSTKPAFVCDICGRVLKNEFGLKGHRRSHK
jgi:hypothetical protein